MFNVLMTGAGAPGAPGIIRCLSRMSWLNLLICDADIGAVGRYLHNGDFFVVPKASDNDFISQIKSICQKKNIHLIIPLVTMELFEFAKCKSEFEKLGIKILVSDLEALNTANNKASLYDFLKDKINCIPDFRRVNTITEFLTAINNLGYPNKPICFKPSISNGSRGFRIINDDISSFDLLFNHKPNNTYITLDQIKSILSTNEFPELIVSEYLPGEEFSVDCIAKKGTAVLIVPRLRKKMVGGISTAGKIIQNEKIIQYSEEIISLIGLHGNIGIQFKRSDSGEYKLLEINPRVQGTIVSILGAGVNMPLLALKQELNIPVDPNEMRVKWDTNFIRFWDEVYY